MAYVAPMRETPSPSASRIPDDPDAWRLRPASLDDVEGVHGLASEPLVYRYLFDGVAPKRGLIAEGVARAMAGAAATGLGLWVLESPGVQYGGCVELRPDVARRSVELVYLLDPGLWGRGLATRMAWAAIGRAFLGPIDVVVAGTDGANAASVAVMRRLGMRFRRAVSYPLGPGVEYALSRDDPGPDERPAVLEMH
jgi:RimJ/RimL family protein N-acetyltransferase